MTMSTLTREDAEKVFNFMLVAIEDGFDYAVFQSGYGDGLAGTPLTEVMDAYRAAREKFVGMVNELFDDPAVLAVAKDGGTAQYSVDGVEDFVSTTAGHLDLAD